MASQEVFSWGGTQGLKTLLIGVEEPLTSQSGDHNHRIKSPSRHYGCLAWLGQQQTCEILPRSDTFPLGLMESVCVRNLVRTAHSGAAQHALVASSFRANLSSPLLSPVTPAISTHCYLHASPDLMGSPSRSLMSPVWSPSSAVLFRQSLLSLISNTPD